MKQMNNLMRASIAALAVFVTMLTGAVAAQAATYYYSTTNHQNGWCTNYTHVNYNWWEESWAGGSHRDYRYATATYQCKPFYLGYVG